MGKLKWAFDSVFRKLVRPDEMGTLEGGEVGKYNVDDRLIS